MKTQGGKRRKKINQPVMHASWVVQSQYAGVTGRCKVPIMTLDTTLQNICNCVYQTLGHSHSLHSTHTVYLRMCSYGAVNKQDSWLRVNLLNQINAHNYSIYHSDMFRHSKHHLQGARDAKFKVSKL
jgi:hypothetical protein